MGPDSFVLAFLLIKAINSKGDKNIPSKDFEWVMRISIEAEHRVKEQKQGLEPSRFFDYHHIF
jgi:hypothetical protein